MPTGESHDIKLRRLIDQTFDEIFRSYDDLIRTLELASAAKDRYTPAVRAELAHGAQVWIDRAERFEQELQAGPLDVGRLDRLAALLPPRRARHRFALERISPGFAQICMDFGSEKRDLLLKALASMSREDVSIAMNLIDHVLEKTPKFYAALLLKGSLLLELQENLHEVPDLLQSAADSPPRIENTTRHKVLALELLAESLDAAGHPSEALRVYRRVQKISATPTTLFDYHIARMLAKARKVGDATTTLDVVFRTDPHFYPTALLDDDFALVRDYILETLEEHSQLWIETTRSVLAMADDVRIIAEDYGLDDDPKLAEGLAELQEIETQAANGSYSLLHDLKDEKLMPWIRTYPGIVQDTLSKSVESRYDSIRKYNRNLHSLVVEKRNRLVQRLGLWWIGAGLLLGVILVLFAQPVMAAVFSFILWLVLGYGVVKLMETRYEAEVQQLKKDPGSLRMVQGEARRVARLKSDMLIQLEKLGEEEGIYGVVAQ